MLEHLVNDAQLRMSLLMFHEISIMSILLYKQQLWNKEERTQQRKAVLEAPC